MRALGLGWSSARSVLACLIFGMGLQANAATSCVRSSQSTWTNTAIATQTAKFTATYDATPSQTNMDGVVGFSLNTASSYTSLAAIVRFSTVGTIDVRNGSSYAADTSMTYGAGQSYHVRMVIDPGAKTYSVYVTPPSGVETTLANNYAFRTQQAGTSSFNNWGMLAAIGSESVCNMTTAIVSVAPTITKQPSSLTVTAGNTATFSVTATSATPLSYQWKKNGTPISGATSASYTTPATTSSDSGALFTVIVANSAGSITSSAATLTVTPVSSCLTSSQTAWTNTAIATQSAMFTATYDATPNLADMNGVVGFSLNAATGYTSLAAIARFSTAGTIDVRNGSGYAADTSLPYTAGQSYHFRMVIDPVAKTYSVYVTPPGGAEIALAGNFTFRSEQAGTSTLNNWAMLAAIGSESVCNMSITTQPSSGGTPAISWTPSSLSFGSVNIGGSKALAITITASGTASTTLANVSISGPGFSASGVPTGLILSPGNSATLNTTFSPSATGSVTGNVVITSNASNAPTARVSLSGTGVQAVSHSATLSWLPSTSSVVGYNVYRGTASGGPYMKMNSSNVLLLTYSDTSVVSGQAYYYCVTSLNAAGQESVYSNEVWAAIP